MNGTTSNKILPIWQELLNRCHCTEYTNCQKKKHTHTLQSLKRCTIRPAEKSRELALENVCLNDKHTRKYDTFPFFVFNRMVQGSLLQLWAHRIQIQDNLHIKCLFFLFLYCLSNTSLFWFINMLPGYLFKHYTCWATDSRLFPLLLYGLPGDTGNWSVWHLWAKHDLCQVIDKSAEWSFINFMQDHVNLIMKPYYSDCHMAA